MERNRHPGPPGGRGARRAAAPVLAALLVLAVPLAACSGDDDGGDGAAATTGPASTSTTTARRPATTTTTAAPTGTCDGLAAPHGDGPAATLPGGADVDGDGARDQVGVVVDGAGTWRLAVDLGGDRGTVVEDLSTVPSDHAEPATAVDLDGDGDDELFVVVGNGAAARIYGIFDLDGCDLEAVQLDGRPAELAAGGSVVELHGLRCDDRGLTVLTATSDDGVGYATEERTYALTDGTLRQEATATGATTTDAADFPALSQFDC